MLEGLIDFVAHLETVETDAWTNLCHQACWACAIGICHSKDSLLDNPLHRSTPTGMDGTDGMMLLVIE